LMHPPPEIRLVLALPPFKVILLVRTRLQDYCQHQRKSDCSVHPHHYALTNAASNLWNLSVQTLCLEAANPAWVFNRSNYSEYVAHPHQGIRIIEVTGNVTLCRCSLRRVQHRRAANSLSQLRCFFFLALDWLWREVQLVNYK
jgi:hypothetical protein